MRVLTKLVEEGSAERDHQKSNKSIRVCGAVVAQLTLNQLVVGSTPTAPIFLKEDTSVFFFIVWETTKSFYQNQNKNIKLAAKNKICITVYFFRVSYFTK